MHHTLIKKLVEKEARAMQALPAAEKMLVILSMLGYGNESNYALEEMGFELSEEALAPSLCTVYGGGYVKRARLCKRSAPLAARGNGDQKLHLRFPSRLWIMNL